VKKWQPLLLALLGGLLLYAAWPTSPLTFLIFIAFIPTLWIEYTVARKWKCFWLTLLTFLIWNVATTWWVGNTPVPLSGILANVLNAIIMCVPFVLFRFTRHKLGDTLGYTSFVVYWMAYEFIHHRWELSWPWLSFGNVFATRTTWVQWYEYTGASGGTLWVLCVNLLLFLALRDYVLQQNKTAYKKSVIASALLLLPIAISLLLYALNKPFIQKGNGNNIVVVQPNIDAYSEKFTAGMQEANLQKLIRLSESQIDNSTALVVWPETALPWQIDDSDPGGNTFLAPLRSFLQRHPQLRLLTGVDSYRYLKPGEKTRAMRATRDGRANYEAYNSAYLYDSSLSAQIYHKGRLVPGAEILPWSDTWLFGWTEKYSLDMGGTMGTLGTGPERTVFTTPSVYKPGPIICYESIYSDFVSAYVRNGANVLAIITNDGWWGDTQGYKQHCSYGRLRAIETRRWIVRSANTGISCFINPTGDTLRAQPWNKEAAIKMTVPTGERITFFVRYGDVLSRVAFWASCVLLLGAIIVWIKKMLHRKPRT
jgi:apolipoprotein N-acyltransferase